MVTKLENFIVYNSGSRSGDFYCKTKRALANTLWERLVYNSLANTGEFVGLPVSPGGDLDVKTHQSFQTVFSQAFFKTEIIK